MDRPIFPFLWMRGEGDAILRREIEKIAQCGIRAVCVEARPHDDFCGPGWWHDMDIVLDEAKKRDMRVWILDDKHFPTGYANGLIEAKYPERKKQYLACTVADVFGASRELTLNVGRMLKPSIGFWQIGEPVDYAERGNNRLFALTALRFEEGSRFHQDAVDLTVAVDDKGFARFTLPEGAWRVHALYITRTDGGNPAYINMLDAASAHTQIEGVYEAHYEHYAAEFGGTIAGFFSDEPQFGNISDQVFDTRPGRKNMPLPWSDEMAAMLRARCGEELNLRLPFLFAAGAEAGVDAQIRFDYMDCATRLYAKNFSRPIGEWCRAHGVEYIGHVVEDNGVHSRLGLGAGHWFRAMEGQDMAGIDVIGSQYCFGAPCETRKGMTEVDGEFFHYALGKLGASGGHLDPKKQGRTMCELFGAYGWGFGVRDMKHLLDHLLCCGVNRLVPHAFSMAEYPDHDCPPHFYAGGHNPQFPFFASLMRYADRMCAALSGGQHAASVAVLYDAELDWSGEHLPMQKVCRALTEHQIEFDIVCLDMLRSLEACNGAVNGGRLSINGVSFGALLVPWAENLPQSLLRSVRQHPDFPVLFVGGQPGQVLRDECGEEPDTALMASLPVRKLAELPDTLAEMGLCPIRCLPAFAPLRVYHYRKNGGQLFMLVNESASRTFRGELTLPTKKRALRLEDGFGKPTQLPASGASRFRLALAPGESCLLTEAEDVNTLPVWRFGAESLEACQGRISLDDWRVSLAPAGDPPVFGLPAQVWTLRPVSDAEPAFSGLIRYETVFTLIEMPQEAWFVPEQVFESLRLTVNGTDAGIRLTPPYAVEIAGLLKEGKNVIMAEVATTPARDQMNYPQAPFDFYHEALEPTGMFGSVEILYRYTGDQHMKLTQEQKAFVEDLLSRMTLEEKIGQMNQESPSIVGGFDVPFSELIEMLTDGRISQEEFGKIMASATQDFHEDDIRAGRVGSQMVREPRKNNELQKIAVEESRLGIPLIIGFDVIHGFRSVFPIAIAEACSFDDDLFESTAHMAAAESRAHGINWNFAPMIDAARDSRWGRVSEGPGEDPTLGSRFARAKIRGLQNDCSSPLNYVAACTKHYVCYGACESGRDYNTTSMSVSQLYNVYLPAFRAAMEEGAATVMAAFNDFNGVPCTVNRWLLRDILKGEMGLEGFVVSDANAIRECVNHGIAEDERDAGVQAAIAGMDMDMGTHIYMDHLKAEVEKGNVPMAVIDEAVRRILSVKVWLGLFENPYVPEDVIEAYEKGLPEAHVALCKRAAEESMVLLKNENNLLPLNRKQKISLVGSLADDRNEVCGAWALAWKPEDCVSVRAGLEAAGANVQYYPCGGPEGEIDFDEADRACREGDVIVAVVGETDAMSGEASSKADISLPGKQRALLERLLASGKPVVTVLMNGRPLALGWEAEHLPAILEAWHLGIRMGDAVAAALLGDVNPSGKLSSSFPSVTGQCPIYYNHPSTGRPGSKSKFTSRYLDAPWDALFPFGHGLSYTSFAYDELRIHRIGQALEITARLRNTGERAGTEVAQLYMQDVSASLVRPVKELKDYRRIELKPGEEKKISFILPLESLGFYDNDGQYRLESGLFRFFVGGSSRDCLRQEIRIAF